MLSMKKSTASLWAIKREKGLVSFLLQEAKFFFVWYVLFSGYVYFESSDYETSFDFFKVFLLYAFAGIIIWLIVYSLAWFVQEHRYANRVRN